VLRSSGIPVPEPDGDGSPPRCSRRRGHRHSAANLIAGGLDHKLAAIVLPVPEREAILEHWVMGEAASVYDEADELRDDIEILNVTIDAALDPTQAVPRLSRSPA
jgi:hypothetical protein